MGDTNFHPSPWFRPPMIRPNLSSIRKKQSLLPRSKVEHVLLHENKTQRNMLETEVNHLKYEHHRQTRTSELHRRAFLVRQSAKQVNLWEHGIDHVRILPELVVETHLPGSKRASMNCSQRRYSIAMKGSKRGSASAPCLSTSQKLSRSKTFHGFDISNDKLKSDNISGKNADTEFVNSDTRKNGEYVTPRLGKTSARLPRKPKILLNSVSVPSHIATSPDSCYSDKSRTSSALNLTKSFTTYNTKFRREVTIADPRSYRYRASDDPRFKRLKTTLIPPERPIDSVLQLSQSGRKVVEKYGNSLYNYAEFNSLIAHLNETFPRRKQELKVSRKEKRSIVPPLYGYLPLNEAFVDDESLYNSPSMSGASSVIFTEAE